MRVGGEMGGFADPIGEGAVCLLRGTPPIPDLCRSLTPKPRGECPAGELPLTSPPPRHLMAPSPSLSCLRRRYRDACAAPATLSRFSAGIFPTEGLSVALFTERNHAAPVRAT